MGAALADSPALFALFFFALFFLLDAAAFAGPDTPFTFFEGRETTSRCDARAERAALTFSSSSSKSNGLSMYVSAPYSGLVIWFKFSPMPVSITTPV